MIGQLAATNAGCRGSTSAASRPSKAAVAGDWKAAAWQLERRFPDAYGRAAQPAVDVTLGGSAAGSADGENDQQPLTRVVFYLPDNGRRPHEVTDVENE